MNSAATIEDIADHAISKNLIAEDRKDFPAQSMARKMYSNLPEYVWNYSTVLPITSGANSICRPEHRATSLSGVAFLANISNSILEGAKVIASDNAPYFIKHFSMNSHSDALTQMRLLLASQYNWKKYRDLIESLRELHLRLGFDESDKPSEIAISLALRFLDLLIEFNIYPNIVTRTAESGISFHIRKKSYYRVVIAQDGEILFIQDKNDLEAEYSEPAFDQLKSYLEIIE